jgi:hypothetical protein
MFRHFLLAVSIFIAASSIAQPFKNEWISYNKTYYKFPVKDEGLFRISKAVLANLSIGEVNAEDFQLWRDGKEQPIYTTESTGPLAANGYIEFYGRPLDGTLDTELFPNPGNHVYKDLSFFSDTSWYYLTVNPGHVNMRFLNEVNTVTTTPLERDSFFLHTNSINFFRGAFSYNYCYGYGIVADVVKQPQLVIRSSVWDAGEGFASTPFNLLYPMNINMSNMQVFRNGGPMKLSFSVMGGAFYNRTISVLMNDSLLNSVFVENFKLQKVVVNEVPISRVTNDATVFKFTSDVGDWPESAQANSLYLTYPRKFHFGNQKVFSFQLPANANGNHLRIGNFLFGAQPPILLDLTNLKRYTGVTKVDSSLFALQPSVTDRKLVLANQADFLRQVTSITPIQFTDYALQVNQGDYLIITSKRIMLDNSGKNQVDEYKQYRSSAEGGSFNVKVMDVEELYDQFSFGVRKHPLSIRNFIQYAVKNFTTKPKFVVLIGRGVDYLGDRYSGNYAGREYLNSVPTWGSPASDNLLAAASNLDPTPLVPVGRISVINGTEIGNYLQKVKQYEKLNASGVFTPANKEWKKEVVQLVGGDDAFFSSVLSNFMNGYTKIISDTLIGAKVKTYVKVNNVNYADDVVNMTNRINDGVGLITYFGHSSTSSIDFNLSSPDDYTNTNGKYPVIIANGCRAGNLFTITGNRLAYYGQSISERFILSPNKGAIGFISNSDYGLFNPLDHFTTEWMKAVARHHYGYGLGEIQQQAIKNTIAIFGTKEFFERLNLEQVILHADPAVIIFPNNKPDYTVTDSLVSVSPLNATVAEDTLVVKAKFLNLGKSIKDSVWAEIRREFPDGRELLVTKVLLKNLYNGDSISVKIPVKGLFDKGTNYIIATIDNANEWAEMSETNNSARIPFEITDEEIRPVYPYNYSIMNAAGFHLTGSTVNAVQDERTYRLQVDTTEFFNSPLLFTKDTTTIGGAVNFASPIAWVNGRVYYWRLAPVFNSVPGNWRSSSFQYLQGVAPGWGQSHFFQHTRSIFKETSLDSTTRKFMFGNSTQNLYLINSIYGYSGDEDSHFSIQENGVTNIYSACVGHSIIFNVFDTLTFKPWENYNQRFGSGALCDWGRQFNFEFSYYPATNRKKIMDFLDSIPKGMIVTARLILDPPYDSSLVKYWQKDTLIFGQGKSLYHSLYKQGFYQLDSMTRHRTFTFVFRKDDSATLKPLAKLSDGLYDRLNNSYFVPTVDSVGEILSPKFGPASNWKEMHWKGHQFEGIDPESYAAVQLIGVDKDNKEFVLKSYQPGEWDNDISDLSAQQYPFLRLKLLTKNAIKARPYQLEYWRLFYDPVPDGALSALDHYYFRKPILLHGKDSLKIELAFKNISGVPLDSCSVKITIGDRDGNTSVFNLNKRRPLAADDTAIIVFNKSSEGMDGKYYALIEVNKEQIPVEQHSFNNFTYIPFEVATALPLMQVDFTANAEQLAARLKWETANEYDVASYTLEHSTNNRSFSSIGGEWQGKNTGAVFTSYTHLHTNPSWGINYYRIKITYLSGKVEYTAIRQVNFAKNGTVIIYPNPFSERITVASPGNQSWLIELFNVQGQRLLNSKGSGSANINTQQLPPGNYFLKLTYNDKVTTMKLEKQH